MPAKAAVGGVRGFQVTFAFQVRRPLGMTDTHELPDTPTPPSTPKPPLSLTVLTSAALFVAVASLGSININGYGALSLGIVAAAGRVAMGVSTRR
jgi:hypothetical protein